mmetsp:Transcript_7330/g.17888  ORF Transcript_7330/g.17888 Transcript_7330/m.17888 type:complete len:431 (+) Transcript_7330:244-1536(+)
MSAAVPFPELSGQLEAPDLEISHSHHKNIPKTSGHRRSRLAHKCAHKHGHGQRHNHEHARKPDRGHRTGHGHEHGPGCSHHHHAPTGRRQSTPLISRLKSVHTGKLVGLAQNMQISGYCRMLWNHSESRKLMIFVGVSGAYSFLQLLHALLFSGVQVMSSALHNMFHFLVLSLSLFAMALSVQGKDTGYTYGYDRCNVLAAFTNGVFLAFMAMFFISEAIHHLTSSHHEHQSSHPLLLATGLLVDLVGLFLFRSYSSLQMRAVRSYMNEYNFVDANGVNLHSIFLHILADNIKTLSHIFLLVLERYRDWDVAAPIVNILVALIILRITIPFIKQTGMVLLQAAPNQLLIGMQKCMKEIMAHEGIIACHDQHWWVFAPGITVGSLKLEVRYDADDQAILTHAHTMLKRYITYMTIQITKQAKQKVTYSGSI